MSAKPCLNAKIKDFFCLITYNNVHVIYSHQCKRKYIWPYGALTLSMVILLLKITLFNNKVTSTVNTNTERQTNSQGNFTTHCDQPLNLYYVKIHKTGSTTFQNILYRIGMKRNLSFALFDCDYGLTYPHPPNISYLYRKPQRFKGHYNLLTDHTMFHEEMYKEYMHPDTKIVTLIRHPLDQLASTFSFWNLPKKYGIPRHTAQHGALQHFLDNIHKYNIDSKLSFGCGPKNTFSQVRNPQGHHLGLKNQSTSDAKKVFEFVKHISDRFSLVLILERLQESLVLFKRMFCLGLKEILHLKLFTRSFLNKNKYEYNTTQRQKLIKKHEDLSSVDYALYYHFNNELDSLIKGQGSEFKHELHQFQSIQQKTREFCKDSCKVFHDIKHRDINYIRQRLNKECLIIEESPWNEEFNVSRADCLLQMLETDYYNSAIKVKQWGPEICELNTNQKANDGHPPNIPTVEPSFCNAEDYFTPYFPVEPFRESTYFLEWICARNF